MFKSITYNEDFPKIAKKSVYELEYDAMHDFCASEHKTMRFEYAATKEAVNAAVALRKYIAQARQPLDVAQRKEFVFVYRKGNKDV